MMGKVLDWGGDVTLPGARTHDTTRLAGDDGGLIRRVITIMILMALLPPPLNP
jgi:hypothetical protein